MVIFHLVLMVKYLLSQITNEYCLDSRNRLIGGCRKLLRLSNSISQPKLEYVFLLMAPLFVYAVHGDERRLFRTKVRRTKVQSVTDTNRHSKSILCTLTQLLTKLTHCLLVTVHESSESERAS